CCISGLKTGEELLSTGRQQAEGFGARFLQEDVIAIAAPSDGTYEVTTESEQSYFAYSLIIATGVTRHGLGLKGEKDLIGKGVSYCVDCDANFYHGARVAVVGDGSAAAYGAVTLSKIARQVTLITRDLKVSPALESALNRENISILRESTVRELKGTDRLEGVVLRDGTDLQLDGLFVEGGAKGAMELVASLGVRLDPEKFT
ncbi:MAG: FAD-dependent oxidoreductase, partial [Nitrospiraceae bacterium]|nr:FAD-dependent oxidoreductase [Nitrospiraceae bacterium]